MQVTDINVDDFNMNKQREASKALFVRFYQGTAEDKVATLENQRPIFKTVDRIEIRVAGSRNVVDRVATHADKFMKFPDHYRAYKNNNNDSVVVGTPLDKWTLISASMVKELEYFNVSTVEQLANMSDGNVGNIYGGHDLKKKAQDYLVLADKEASKHKELELERTLEEKDEKIIELQNQMAVMMKKVDSLGDKKPTRKTTTTRKTTAKQRE